MVDCTEVPPDAGHSLLEVFRRYDASGGGIIPSRKLARVLRKLGLEDSSVDRAVAAVGNHADGGVDYEAFVGWLMHGSGRSPPTCSKQQAAQLLQAAEQGRPELVTELLRARTDPNAADAFGYTPLMRAAQLGQAAALAALLAARAEPDQARRTGMTPLMLAARAGHVEAVAALLGARADADRQNVYGRTALGCAELAGIPKDSPTGQLLASGVGKGAKP